MNTTHEAGRLTDAERDAIWSSCGMRDALPSLLRATITTAIESAVLARAQGEAVACKGIPRAGCDYLAFTDTVCNKCGEVHRHSQMVAAFRSLAAPTPAQEPQPVQSGAKGVAREADDSWMIAITNEAARVGVTISPQMSAYEALRAVLAMHEMVTRAAATLPAVEVAEGRAVALTAEQMRPHFEYWYVTRSVFAPLGSRECAVAWAAWLASGGYTAPSDWKVAPMPWGLADATPTPGAASDAVRADFERWLVSKGGVIDRLPDGEYESWFTGHAWEGWQAHAALATTPSAEAVDAARWRAPIAGEVTAEERAALKGWSDQESAK